MQLYINYQEEVEDLNQQFELVEEGFSKAISRQLWELNGPSAQVTLDSMVTLIDGMVYAAAFYYDDSGLKGMGVATGTLPVNSSLSRKIDLVTPFIGYEIKKLGELEVFADENAVRKKVLDSFYFVLVSQGIKTFFVSIFILFLIHQIVIRHVTQILNWLQAFKPDTSFRPLALNSNQNKSNEIDDLKGAISGMGKLVHQHTVSLEKMVEQRTVELHRRTEELENTQLELHKLLWEKEQKLVDVSETISDWLWDLDQFGNICSISDEFAQLLGLAIDTSSPVNFVKALPFNIVESTQDNIDSIKNSIAKKSTIEPINCCVQSVNNQLTWLTLVANPYYSKTGEFLGYHGSAKDITHQKHLEKLAYTDGLTGIANRVSFFYRAEKELHRSRRLSYDLGVIMLDLDYFKKINDNYGHEAGDEVLKSTATAMEACLREEDCIGRIGGEEFAIIVPGADKLGLHNLVTRIQDVIQLLEFSFLDEGAPITVSIGYTVVKDNEIFKAALKRADTHLYTAKSSGRNCFVTDKEFIRNIVS